MDDLTPAIVGIMDNGWLPEVVENPLVQKELARNPNLSLPLNCPQGHMTRWQMNPNKRCRHSFVCFSNEKVIFVFAIFSTFLESHLKHTPKVGVHRENLLIGNVAQVFFRASHICWDYVISFSQHFPMRKFSPSPSTSPSPESHALFENWLKIGH